MLGETNDTRNKTENTTDEACYGGFGGRFSYEECTRVTLGGKVARIVPKLVFGGVAVLLLGMLGTLCAVMMYSVVNDNHSIRHPDAIFFPTENPSDDTVEPVTQALKQPQNTSNVAIWGNLLLAENVTAEQSDLYRVPTGVMIQNLETDNLLYLLGMRNEDIIVEFDGQAVQSVDELRELIDKNRNDIVPMLIFRNSSYVKIFVEIG